MIFFAICLKPTSRGIAMAKGQLLAIISKGIEGARINFPDYPLGSGAPWGPVYVEAREARLFAHAALEAIDRAGFAIIPKELLPTAPAS